MSYTRTTWQNGETALSAANLNNMEDGIEEALGVTRNLLNLIYPVGSIYLSVNTTDPGTLFPGTTWEKIKDRFLLASGDTYTSGNTGGAATVTLTLNQIPSHTHNVTYAAYSREAGNNPASTLDYTSKTKATSSAGGGQAHNNMPPYLVINVWKRLT